MSSPLNSTPAPNTTASPASPSGNPAGRTLLSVVVEEKETGDSEETVDFDGPGAGSPKPDVPPRADADGRENEKEREAGRVSREQEIRARLTPGAAGMKRAASAGASAASARASDRSGAAGPARTGGPGWTADKWGRMAGSGDVFLTLTEAKAILRVTFADEDDLIALYQARQIGRAHV